METLDRTRADRIAALNDRVRQNLNRNARIVFTHGCVATFDDGNAASAILDAGDDPENDPLARFR